MPISTILADDHAILRQGLATLLRAELDVQLLGEAANGETAWRLIATHQPDVAVLDLAMPGASGLALARRIESAGLATRVVLLTMYANPANVLEAERTGVAGYVLKDSLFEELILAVRTVAAGGTFMTPAVRAKLHALRRNGHAPPALSAREQEVVRLLSQGQSSKEIARALGVSPGTVETYRRRLMQKLDLHSATEVVRWAVEGGLVV
jgi:DNA-binding NarL/FixJ family response regulator